MNTEKPENNCELFIITLKDAEGKDKKLFYCAYALGIQVDSQFNVDDLSQEPFEAIIYSTITIFESMPAYLYSFLQENSFSI